MKLPTWKSWAVLVAMIGSVCTSSLHAGEKSQARGKWEKARRQCKVVEGSFVFAHSPPEQILEPGDEFQVEGGFSGSATVLGEFGGFGEAQGQLLLQPVPTPLGILVADYRGELRWDTVGGSLYGYFYGVDFLTDPNLPVFQTVVVLTFVRGCGQYRHVQGSGIAWGIDDPYDFIGIGGVGCDFVATLYFSR
jgi:hypothetical protein